MVVMCRKDVAAIVALARDFGNDVEKLVTFHELIVYVHTNTLHPFDGLWRYPNDGFIHHFLAVCLIKLNG